MSEEKSRYFKELALNLQREGFTVGQPEDGLLPVELDGQRLCRTTEGGGVRYRKEDVSGDSRGTALERVIAITKATADYMALIEAAPPLKAKGLERDYRLLAEVNNTVLAGHPTQQDVQFVTWERDFDKAGLCWGHYLGEDYEKAKRDFATRSELILCSALFAPEQLAEVYRCIQETLDSGNLITVEREKLLESTAGKSNRLSRICRNGSASLIKRNWRQEYSMSRPCRFDDVWPGSWARLLFLHKMGKAATQDCCLAAVYTYP